MKIGRFATVIPILQVLSKNNKKCLNPGAYDYGTYFAELTKSHRH